MNPPQLTKQPQPTTEPSPDFAPLPQEHLHQEYLQAFHTWQALFQDSQCLTDFSKRQAMFAARRVYQEAKLQYFFSKRAG